MTRPARKSALPLSLLAAGAAVALLAAKCERTTEFPPYVQEICADKVDNDEDGKADCADTDCSLECNVKVVMFTPSPTSADSFAISGTHVNASSISITVSPSGNGGAATLSGGNWSFTIRNLSQSGPHSVTAIATSAEGLKDTATATFNRSQ